MTQLGILLLPTAGCGQQNTAVCRPVHSAESVDKVSVLVDILPCGPDENPHFVVYKTVGIRIAGNATEQSGKS